MGRGANEEAAGAHSTPRRTNAEQQAEQTVFAVRGRDRQSGEERSLLVVTGDEMSLWFGEAPEVDGLEVLSVEEEERRGVDAVRLELAQRLDERAHQFVSSSTLEDASDIRRGYPAGSRYAGDLDEILTEFEIPAAVREHYRSKIIGELPAV